MPEITATHLEPITLDMQFEPGTFELSHVGIGFRAYDADGRALGEWGWTWTASPSRDPEVAAGTPHPDAGREQQAAFMELGRGAARVLRDVLAHHRMELRQPPAAPVVYGVTEGAPLPRPDVRLPLARDEASR